MSARAKKPAAVEEPVVRFIPIDQVIPPSENRDELGDMERLTESIKARGVAQPILVRPGEDGTYQLVFGERRWRAAKAAGQMAIKAEIRDLDELEATLEQIAENMDRKDLTSLEKAKAPGRAARPARVGGQARQVTGDSLQVPDAAGHLQRVLGVQERVRRRPGDRHRCGPPRQARPAGRQGA